MTEQGHHHHHHHHGPQPPVARNLTRTAPVVVPKCKEHDVSFSFYYKILVQFQCLRSSASERIPIISIITSFPDSEYALYDFAVCNVQPNRAIPEEQQQNVMGQVTLFQKV